MKCDLHFTQIIFMKLIDREIERVTIEISKSFPVIVITGPRQTGKTTLCKKLFPNKPYSNLEQPDIRNIAINDPHAYLQNYSKSGAIIDEIQYAPELLSYIQQIVDNKNQKGFFILTGSNHLLMMEKISQSLAGRAAILNLLPFSMNELALYNQDFNTNEYLYRGFYPAIYSESQEPLFFYRNYFATYIERDVRQLTNVKDYQLFQTFIKLCASRIGQVFNANTLANEVGVSHNTIKSWMSILQISYVVHLLPPYYKNIGKRLIKSSKLYFYDVGLAAYLLDIEKISHIKSHPLRGELFENLVVNEYVKSRTNQGLEPNLYFFRDSHHNEVDLIQPSGNHLKAIEIKSAQTFHPNFCKSLDYFENLFKEHVDQKIVIYTGPTETNFKNTQILNYKTLLINKE